MNTASNPLTETPSAVPPGPLLFLGVGDAGVRLGRTLAAQVRDELSFVGLNTDALQPAGDVRIFGAKLTRGFGCGGDLQQGRLAAEGDYHAIRELMDDRPHRIRVRADTPRALAGALLDEPGVVAVRLDGADVVVVDTVDAARFRTAVARLAARTGTRLFEVMPLDDDLESVFRYLVGT